VRCSAPYDVQAAGNDLETSGQVGCVTYIIRSVDEDYFSDPEG
jgi:hypothetical protein